MRGSNTIQTKKAPKKESAKGSATVSVSNAVTLDANNPIPFDYSGKVFTYVGGNRYLPFLGQKDDFGKQLLESRMLSVTHNACIMTKARYCAGTGFHDSDGKDFDPSIKDWLESLNRHNQSATAVNTKIFDTYFTFGNAPIEVVRYTVSGKPRLHVYAHNFLEWRLAPPDEDDVVTHAVQSKLFLRSGVVYLTSEQLKSSKKLPIYNPLNSERRNWLKDKNGVERTLIWHKHAITGINYYGLPSAVSSMIHQILEYKAARFNLDNFENNMVPAAILALKGNLSDQEAQKIAKKIIQQHTGDGKRGRTVVVASEEGIDGSNVHKLDNKTDGSFNESDKGWMEKIILANQWDAILAGIISPSTLGKGSGFLTKIYELKRNTVIKPAQQDLMEAAWGDIFVIAQKWLGLPFDKYNISIKDAIDISGLTDVDITSAVTRNEVRTAKGLPKDPTPAGEEYMTSKGSSTSVGDPGNQGGNNV